MPVPSTPIEKRSLLRDDVYEHLLAAIVSGTFAPGEQLRDSELADWLGVSRTPIREAVLRLGQIGLVDSKPGRSTFVTEIDLQEEKDAKSVLASMHRLAVDESLENLTSRHWEQLHAANAAFVQALRSGDIDAALSADDAFHHVFVSASGNGAIASVIENFTPLIRRAEIARFTTGERSPGGSVGGHDSPAHHDRLIELAQAKSPEAGQVAFNIWMSLPHGS